MRKVPVIIYKKKLLERGADQKLIHSSVKLHLKNGFEDQLINIFASIF